MIDYYKGGKAIETIETIVTKPEVKYKTVDGKVFDNIVDAKRHENKLWWKAHIQEFDYGEENYYFYIAGGKEEQEKFFDVLKNLLSPDFQPREYGQGDKIVVGYMYSVYGRDIAWTTTLEDFLKTEKDKLRELGEELDQIEKKFGDDNGKI